MGSVADAHGGRSGSRGLEIASLDHAMWFHAPCTFQDWHLYTMDSPWTGNARGFNRGAIYDQSGRLVASVAQEGLVRPLKPKE